MAVHSRTQKSDAKQPYPYLGIHSGDKPSETVIVLFTAEKTGVAVFVGEKSGWSEGCYHQSWAEDVFSYYDGAVVLENK